MEYRTRCGRVVTVGNAVLIWMQLAPNNDALGIVKLYSLNERVSVYRVVKRAQSEENERCKTS